MKKGPGVMKSCWESVKNYSWN